MCIDTSYAFCDPYVAEIFGDLVSLEFELTCHKRKLLNVLFDGFRTLAPVSWIFMNYIATFCKRIFMSPIREHFLLYFFKFCLYFFCIRLLESQLALIQSRIWAIPFLPSHAAWQDMGCIIATKHRESGWSASHNSKFFSPLINMSHPKAGEHFFKGTSFSLSVPSFQLLKMDKKRDMEVGFRKNNSFWLNMTPPHVWTTYWTKLPAFCLKKGL